MTLPHWRQEMPDTTMCLVCTERPAVIRWGTFRHSSVSRCERCAYGEQVRHALGRVKALPRLVVRFGWAVLRNV